MHLNDDPKAPYSRARATKLNAGTLRNNDETFAKIDHHISHLRHRSKLDMKHILKD